MTRPFIKRNISSSVSVTYYKPKGVPLKDLEQVSLKLDELEALRLADFEGMYQADAAKKMNVSRQTFGLIIKQAHKKIADALINGKAIQIECSGLEVLFLYLCSNCGFEWKSKKDEDCPKCNSEESAKVQVNEIHYMPEKDNNRK